MNRFLTVLAVVIVTPLITAGSCATTSPEPKIVIQTVNVPVPVACAQRPGPERVYPDSDAALRAAVDLFDRVKLLLAGRELRIADAKTLRAGFDGCP